MSDGRAIGGDLSFRLQERLNSLILMRLDETLFLDASGCRKSLLTLQEFVTERPTLSQESLLEIETQIFVAIVTHVKNHLAELLGAERDEALQLLGEFEQLRSIDALPDLLAAIAGINRDSAKPIDVQLAELRSLFTDRQVAGDQLAVLMGRWNMGSRSEGRPAGSAIIAGPTGSGKSHVIALFANFINQNFACDAITHDEIDLREYSDQQNGAARLIDHLCDLAGDEDRHVYCFNGIEEASLEVREILQRLASDGTTRVGRNACQISGSFLFFVLPLDISGHESPEQLRSKVASLLGHSFCNAVPEIIVLPPMTDDLLHNMLRKYIDQFLSDFAEKTDIHLTLDKTMLDLMLFEVQKRGTQGHAAPGVVEDLLSIPVADLRTKIQLPGNRGHVIVEDGVAVLLQGGRRHPLPLASRLKSAGEPFTLDLEAELQQLVGLEPVKERLRGLQAQLIADRRRREAGIEVNTSQSRHMLFTGNPGTGKTTVARIVARLLRDLGVLRKGQLVEAGRVDLVAGYVGQTAIKTTKKINEALGGVLFIDEAYALTRNSGGFGLEAIDTLIPALENLRDDLVVILAGYTQEMSEFLKSNPGLRSRIPFQIEFPDYSAAELAQITIIEARHSGFTLAANVIDKLESLFDSVLVAGRSDQGNGRLVRSTVEEAIRRQSERLLADETASQQDLVTLTSEDFLLNANVGEASEPNALSQLDALIGLSEIKEFLRDLDAQVKLDKQRRSRGIQVNSGQSLHMLFTGNPGTGKTTVARILGQLLKDLGILKTGHVVEVGRESLVGAYLGHTAIKTSEKIKDALGGILFLDEAYTLAQDAFGGEALATLIKGMEDHRDSLIVIMAGYSREMQHLLDVNPGLRSRFPNNLEFRDYTAGELFDVGARQLMGRGRRLSAAAEERLRYLCEAAVGNVTAGNARYVRNLLEAAERRQARRLVYAREQNDERLATIEAEDLIEIGYGS